MIGRVEGTLLEREPGHVLVDVSGVGYELLISLRTFEQLPEPGKTVALHVRTVVREDAITLFGFASGVERRVFDLLLRASRVGPKLAQAILSGVEPTLLLRALRDGEVSVLKRSPGVGPKLAERMAVELRDRAADELKIGAPDAGEGTVDEPIEDVSAQLVSALLNLGYPRSQAEKVADKAVREAGAEASLESAIRVALRHLAP
jgi:Holliday junction DNA helicase RuvA